MSFGIAAAVGGTLVGAYTARKGAKDQAQAVRDSNQAQIEANALDPRIGQMLYGSDPNANNGLLAQYAGLQGRPQNLGAQQFGKANDNYAWAFTAPDLEAARGGAQRLLAGNTAAPQMNAASMVATGAPTVATLGAPAMQAARAAQGPATQAASSNAAWVHAPSQNSLNLDSSFGSLINGEAGANPHLTGAIQKGINQSSNAFGNMLSDAKNATQDVLGGIRGNSVLAGQYGGSRQGIAEGKAMEALTTQLGRAASQFGQNNTDAAVAAQAGAYDADRNRQLSATLGLSGQQYAKASQDAAMQQQAAQANADRQQQTGQFNAGLQQSNNQFNAGLEQQAGALNTNLAQQTGQFNAGLSQNNAQFNANMFQDANRTNAGLLQDANKTNLGAQLSTNGLNQQGVQAGTGLLSGLTQQAGANAGQFDQYDLTKAMNVNGLLQPYLSKNPVPTQLQPVYNNSGGAALGGAMAGMGLFNMYNNASKPTSVGETNAYNPFDPGFYGKV